MKRNDKEFINGNLFWAAGSLFADLVTVKEYLAKGADPNRQEGKYTALQVAIIGNRLEAAECLLQHGADPNMKAKKGWSTPLIEANSAEMVKLLARYGVDPYITDGHGNNAFVYFAISGCLDAVKAWFELGWKLPGNLNKILDSLLAHGKFEMIEAITGFKFTADTPIAKIAEFKALYTLLSPSH